MSSWELSAGPKSDLLKGLGHIKCLGFSRNGRLLALGGEDSSLLILEWPSATIKKQLLCAPACSAVSNHYAIDLLEGFQGIQVLQE